MEILCGKQLAIAAGGRCRHALWMKGLTGVLRAKSFLVVVSPTGAERHTWLTPRCSHSATTPKRVVALDSVGCVLCRVLGANPAQSVAATNAASLLWSLSSQCSFWPLDGSSGWSKFLNWFISHPNHWSLEYVRSSVNFQDIIDKLNRPTGEVCYTALSYPVFVCTIALSWFTKYLSNFPIAYMGKCWAMFLYHWRLLVCLYQLNSLLCCSG